MSQDVLDALFENDKAKLEGDRLTILSKEPHSFKLVPAYKFVAVADGSADTHKMVGNIFTKEELEKANVDIYMDSAIYKDIAYQVEPGFLGIPETKEAETAMQELDIEKLLEEYLLKIF